MTEDTWKSHVNRIDQKHLNVIRGSLDTSEHNKHSKPNTKRKLFNHKGKSKIKKMQKNGVAGKKKRRRKPVLQNSPITYIKLPAEPYSFVRTEDSSSSYYSPKSSASSYFDKSPLQALFKGVFGEADKSGKLKN